MKQYLLSLAVISILCLSPKTVTAQYIFGPDEYLIYATVIDAWFLQHPEKKIIIKDHTGAYTRQEDLETELNYVYQEIPVLSRQTINDFKAKNLTHYSLDTFINQRKDYQFISERELINLFDRQEGWGRFYARYPQAEGIFTLSRVGLNDKKTQALVCIANQWDRFSGSGLYLLLTKENDTTWVIRQKIRVWNSWLLDRIQ
jgi:hypothetical protein